MTYDNLHRVTSKVGTNTLSYSYPNNGLQLTAASPVATDTINLNLLGQPTTSITWMAGQRYLRTYHYTSSGLQDSLYVTGGVNLTTRGYGYDTDRGALTSIKLGTATTTIARRRPIAAPRPTAAATPPTQPVATACGPAGR